MGDRFHRYDGFSSGADPENPNWQVDRAGTVKQSANTVVVSGTETVAYSSTGVVFNEQGADVDLRIESDTNSNHIVSDAGAYSGVGAVSFGAAVPTYAYINENMPALTATADSSFSRHWIGSTNAVTVPTGTATVVSSLIVDEPNITATGTASAATTVYVTAAPTEGTVNYALWVDAGTVRLDGNATTGALSLGAAAPTNPQAFAAVLPPANASGVTANQSYHHIQALPGGATTIPTGTAPIVSTMNLNEPNITATGTVTDAVTLRIADAPTEGGTGNYALWVDSGVTRLDGSSTLGALTLGAAAPTNPQAFVAVVPPANASGITANQSYFHQQILAGGATVIPTGTAPVAASLNVHEPNLTATGTITDACTARIVDAPTEGGRNYSLWVDAGVSRFDDTVVISNGTNLAEPSGMTCGLFIEQAGADDDAIQLSSTDVTHGVTTYVPTNTYASLGKAAAADGGLLIRALTDVTTALLITAVSTTADTTDAPTTSSLNTANIRCAATNGTGVQALGATANIFGVQNHDGTNEFVVKGDGELYSNQSATVGTFDDYEDDKMAWDLAHTLAGREDQVKKYTREMLEKAGLLTPGGMVSLNQMHQLALCGLGYLGDKLNAANERLAQLEAKINLLTA